MQNTLEINADKSILHLVYVLWGIFLLVSSVLYLNQGITKVNVLVCAVFLIKNVLAHITAIQSLKRKITINLSEKKIYLKEFTFFGNPKNREFSTGDFNAVRSYIHSVSEGGNSNILELVHLDGCVLHIETYRPSSGNKFWVFDSGHLENPEAKILRLKIASLMNIKDLGFTGITYKQSPQIK